MNLTIRALANIGGRLWAAVMSFAFVPIYIHFLGIESYGLIGFGVTILAIFLALDLGLGTAINRELARMSVEDDWRIRGGTLLRTLEVVYWSTAIAIGALIVIVAPLIAGRWLNTTALSTTETVWAIRILGVSIIMRWPSPLYLGALMGLDKQIAANVVTAGAATVTSGGAALVLWLVNPSVIAFFIWQAIASLVQVAVLRVLAWKAVNSPNKSRFAFIELVGLARFSAGLTGIAALSLFLTQADKLLLSKLLPLESFGYYALASSIAGALSIAAIGMYNAVLPSFSAAVKSQRKTDLARTYHNATQGLAVVIFPAVFTIALFSRELLALYTHNPLIAENTYVTLAMLAAGNGLLAMMLLPLALQLAHGWTSLSIIKNLIAVPIFVPLLWWLTVKHGGVGAAVAWLTLTLGYVALEPVAMHRRVLRGELRAWYLIDLGIPFLTALTVVGAFRLAMPSSLPPVAAWVLIACCGLAALTAAVIATPSTRVLATRACVAAVRQAGRLV